MPGPCNLKKKRGNQAKKDKREKLRRAQRSSESATSSSPHGDKPEPVQWHDPDLETTPPSCRPTSLSPLEFSNANFERTTPNSSPDIPEGTPYVYIHDPGNGPRVRDTRAFLSSFFAHPPAIHDPLCAEFAQEEVLQMLVTILPEETALVGGLLLRIFTAMLIAFSQILWYNKSRVTGRICPACQRLYRLGDSLPDHFVDFEAKRSVRKTSPQLAREQKISGLCTFPSGPSIAWMECSDKDVVARLASMFHSSFVLEPEHHKIYLGTNSGVDQRRDLGVARCQRARALWGLAKPGSR
jgi:hypothetical protein